MAIQARNSNDKADGLKAGPTEVDKAERPELPADIALLDDAVHRPDPFYQVGTMDTSGTGGARDNSVEAVTPIFAQSRVRNLQVAAKALDPDDDTPSELVVLPEGTVTVSGSAKTTEDGKNDVFRALEKATAKK